MPVTDVAKDRSKLTMTLTAELDAPVERAWKLWADPRQLERWWGPPECPATVVDHDLTPGGRVTYFMALPDGTRANGWWSVLRVEPPLHLEFEDGFADDAGDPNLEMPVSTGTVDLHDNGGRTRMVISTRFQSAEAMDQLLSMGMEEGILGALSQMDTVVAA